MKLSSRLRKNVYIAKLITRWRHLSPSRRKLVSSIPFIILCLGSYIFSTNPETATPTTSSDTAPKPTSTKVVYTPPDTKDIKNPFSLIHEGPQTPIAPNKKSLNNPSISTDTMRTIPTVITTTAKEPVKTQAKFTQANTLPTLKLTGIINFNNRYTALITYQQHTYRLHLGDSWQQTKVTKITSRALTLTTPQGNITYTL